MAWALVLVFAFAGWSCCVAAARCVFSPLIDGLSCALLPAFCALLGQRPVSCAYLFAAQRLAGRCNLTTVVRAGTGGAVAERQAELGAGGSVGAAAAAGGRAHLLAEWNHAALAWAAIVSNMQWPGVRGLPYCMAVPCPSCSPPSLAEH